MQLNPLLIVTAVAFYNNNNNDRLFNLFAA